jgi:hypothetical protein
MTQKPANVQKLEIHILYSHSSHQVMCIPTGIILDILPKPNTNLFLHLI